MTDLRKDSTQSATRPSGPVLSMSLRPVGAGGDGLVLRPGETISVGSDALNRLQLSHASVLAYHCRLKVEADRVVIVPLGEGVVSVRGKLLVRPTVLRLGTVVHFGALAFELASGVQGSRDAPGGASFRDAVWQSFRSAPWFVVSGLLHFLIFLLLQQVVWQEANERRSVALRSGALPEEADFLDEVPAPDEVDLVEPEVEALEVGLDDVEESWEEPSEEAHEEFSFSEASDLVVGQASHGAGGGLLGSAAVVLAPPGPRGSGSLSGHLTAMRGSGLDVVFVIDTTSSMGPFLDGAKNTIDRFVTLLAALVQDLSIGIVAYRDRGDEYVTRSLDLSQDRYEILNFLEDLYPAGGGDVPEAVSEALSEAVHQVHWRSRSSRVVILVGDAPPHESSWNRLRSTVVQFVRARGRSNRSVVSTIFAGDPELSDPDTFSASSAFAEIARLGQGDFLPLGQHSSVDRRMLLTVIGVEYESQVWGLLASLSDGPRERLIQRKVEENDVDWLVGKVGRVPIHPNVVQALIQIGGRRVLESMRQILLDDRQHIASRNAALYVLRRTLRRPVRIDPTGQLERQRAEIERLDLLIGAF